MIFLGDVMSRKKKIIILACVCFVVLIGAFIVDVTLSKSYLTKIKFDDLIEKIENEDDLILLISQTTCSHCASYKPKLAEVAKKYKINIYYIEANLLNDDQKDKFKSYINFDGTPVTIFLKDGKETTVASRINGNSSIEKIEKKLKSNGFID